MTDERDRRRAVCERVLQMGHRTGRWCNGVAVVGLMMLSEGIPASHEALAADLDALEHSVRSFIGEGREAASG